MVKVTSQTGALKAPAGTHNAGRGLQLRVPPSGDGGSWICRFTLHGKQRDRGLGPIDLVTFTEATEEAQRVRKLARQGIDPFAKATAKAVPTFSEFSVEVHERLKPTFKNAKHAAQWLTTITVYANPIIGDMPIGEVDQAAVLRVMHQQVTNNRTKVTGDFWLTSNETANRSLQRIAKVLDVAQSSGFRDAGENPVRVIRAANILPKIKKNTDAHHAALPWKDLPAFWSSLSERTDTSGEALRLLILTGVRTSEVLGAAWSEIDLDAATWTIPAGRMKAGREHVVPLSTQAVELLRARLALRGKSDLIFQGQRAGKPLSNMAMLALLKRMNRPDITAHGFRSSLRDWCGDHGVDRVVAEAMLAHATGDKTEQAYARSTMVERRRPTSQAFADFVTGAASASVTPIRGASL